VIAWRTPLRLAPSLIFSFDLCHQTFSPSSRRTPYLPLCMTESADQGDHYPGGEHACSTCTPWPYYYLHRPACATNSHRPNPFPVCSNDVISELFSWARRDDENRLWSEHAKLGWLSTALRLVTWAILSSSTYSPAPTEHLA
jgi:hypothetical protein